MLERTLINDKNIKSLPMMSLDNAHEFYTEMKTIHKKYPIQWSEHADRIIQERYSAKDEFGKPFETKEDVVERVVKHLANDIEEYDIFYEMISSAKFLPNTPTFVNAGKSLGMLSACLVLPTSDSIEGWAQSLKEHMICTKAGVGTGFDLSVLRGQGTIIRSTGGKSAGALGLLHMLNEGAKIVVQGSIRPSANMATLRINHPDLLEFIKAKSSEIKYNADGTHEKVFEKFQLFNLSVTAFDDEIEAMFNGDNIELISPLTGKPVGSINGGEILKMIAQYVWEGGDPGLLFLTPANTNNIIVNVINPLTDKFYGIKFATNPCVSGDTLVNTDKGTFMIKDLINKQYKILTEDSHHTPKIIIKTRENETLYRIELDNGIIIKATKDHEFVVIDKKNKVMLKDLKSGMKLPLSTETYGFGKKGTLEEGEIAGIFSGDGSNTKHNGAVLYLYDKLLDQFKEGFYGKPVGIHESYSKPRGVVYLNSLKDIPLKHSEVDYTIFSMSKNFIKGYLRGLYSADGYVYDANGTITVGLSSNSQQFLRDVQQLLLSMKIYSKIHPEHDGGLKTIRDKEYITKPTFRLLSNGEEAFRFIKDIGFTQISKNDKGKDLIKNKTFYNIDRSKPSIIIIEKEEGLHDVYDIIESFENKFVANGIVIGNCGEQWLYPYSICNLGSINLSKFVNDKGAFDFNGFGEYVEHAITFLNNVIDHNNYPLPEIMMTAHYLRNIGLGVMGWADALIKMNIRYDSDDAIQMAHLIMNEFKDRAEYQSTILAQRDGVAPVLNGLGIIKRNYELTCIAPTGTISMIAGCSSGIEPNFSYVMEKKTTLKSGSFFIVNDALEGYLDKHLPEQKFLLLEKISKSGGIITDEISHILGFKPNECPFITSFDVDPKWHIDHQATFQEYVDNAVSKTINVPEEFTQEDIIEAYKYAWKKGCKGITIYRNNSRSYQVLNITKKDEPVTVDMNTSDFHAGDGVIVIKSTGLPEMAVGVPLLVSKTNTIIHIQDDYDPPKEIPIDRSHETEFVMKSTPTYSIIDYFGCKHKEMIMQEGCEVCKNCGASVCS